jgi:hypothetical protein
VEPEKVAPTDDEALTHTHVMRQGSVLALHRDS